MNTGLNSAYFMLKKLFRKYFQYGRMTFMKCSKFYFSAANIYAQFAPVNTGLNSAYIMTHNFFESTSGMRE